MLPVNALPAACPCTDLGHAPADAGSLSSAAPRETPQRALSKAALVAQGNPTPDQTPRALAGPALGSTARACMGGGPGSGRDAGGAPASAPAVSRAAAAAASRARRISSGIFQRDSPSALLWK